MGVLNDGRWLITGGGEYIGDREIKGGFREICLWDLEDGRSLVRRITFDTPARYIDVSPDGKWLAIDYGSGDKDGYCHIDIHKVAEGK